MQLWNYMQSEVMHNVLVHQLSSAQLAGAVEYTDCFSAEEQDPLTQQVSCISH